MYNKYQLPQLRTFREEPTKLQSTKSYIYYTDDSKGEGATGRVYGGREKKLGERVAVKVFNDGSYRRPGSVQEREFEVILKLQHRNIVKLLAIEEDQQSKSRVIVMELCEGGSLFNVLEKPENAYGLEESEFLILLKDLGSGMDHLQQKNIVHRDIKPGNIMCCYAPDGSSIYKLADFGAARELAVGENFVSLYGTEEYLHPDVYRAIVSKPLVRPFTSSVDLWSVGVTLYQAATGLLPFRPYGGRTNKTVMHNMISSKAYGIISGVQIGSENGQIEWSRTLPKTAQLSRGLCHHVEKLLVGILESDIDKMWSFPTFLRFAKSIVNSTVLDVFCTTTSQLIKVYMEPKDSVVEFQERIAVQTSIKASNQLIVHTDNSASTGGILNLASPMECSALPQTSPEEPMFLFMVDSVIISMTPPSWPETPTIPQISSKYSLQNDAPSAKESIAGLFVLRRNQWNLLEAQTLQEKAIKALTRCTQHEETDLQRDTLKLDITIRGLSSTLQNTKTSNGMALCAVRLARVVPQNRRHSDDNGCAPLDEVCCDLQKTEGKVAEMQGLIQQLYSRGEELTKRWEDVTRELNHHNGLARTWTENSVCRAVDRCQERFDVLFNQQTEIHANFVRDSCLRSLSFNSEQIHKMEKIKFNDLSSEVHSLVQNHCEKHWSSNHVKLMNWSRSAFTLRDEMGELKSLVGTLQQDLSTQEESVAKLGREIIDKVLNIGLISSTSSGYNSYFYQKYVPSYESVSVGLQTSLPQILQCIESATQTDELTNRQVQLESTSTCRVVLVPKDLKNGMSKWEQERASTLDRLWKSQELVQGMRNISIPTDEDATCSLDVTEDEY